MKTIINNHNKNILGKKPSINTSTCNCRNKEACPLNELSKELWQIKIKNNTPKMTWRMIRKCLPYNYKSRKCYLQLNEKLEIALYERENLLNKKKELISK